MAGNCACVIAPYNASADNTVDESDALRPFTVQEVNKRIGWSGIALGSRARHLWIFAPEAGGTRVTTQESMEGWLPSVMKLVTPRMLEKSLDAWLRDLKGKVEN